MKRRSFLQHTGLAAFGTMLLPNFLQGRAFQQNSARRLIIVQLSGGNDGLNTLVPYRNDEYYKLRPKLGLKATDLLPLTDQQGLHTALKDLKNFYDQGDLCIYNSVGYPNPDRSHFRSMDIWHTASHSHENLSTGWLGRYLDAHAQTAHQALELDDSLSLALKGKEKSGFAMTEPQKLQRLLRNPQIERLLQTPHDASHENLGYLQKTLLETESSAAYLLSKSKVKTTTGDYPNGAFGRDVQQAASLILGGCDTKIYYLSLGGFDTHASQLGQQAKLLEQLNQALAALAKDLKAAGQWQDTLVMVFSEFGRRVAENGSGGTDHGTANQVYLLGGGLSQKGIQNAVPNLTDLDQGDLKHQLDFRNIYAGILQHWLKVQAQPILNWQEAVKI